MNDIKKIAIIGSGISGLTAAHLLHEKYDISIFEVNNYIGGHTNTVIIDKECGNYAVDTGFIVFNKKTYPNFIKLLDKLDVEKQESNMSFSFSSQVHGLEYSGNTLSSMFSQRKNVFNPKFYRLLKDIYSFNKRIYKLLEKNINLTTLKKFVEQERYGSYFEACYLNPLASAIWSTPTKYVSNMPASFVFNFYANHGLLDIIDRPQWYVIKGGSNQYVKKIIKPFFNAIRLNEAVRNIKRYNCFVEIETNSSSERFDAVVLSCHSDQALQLLDMPTPNELRILKSIPYIQNKAVLHTDSTILPKSKRAWSSWNYLHQNEDVASLTYYMNKLQSLTTKEDFLVSINNDNIDESKIIQSFDYAHPLYSESSVEAKKQHDIINHKNRTFFTGAYWGNGFHEDGVNSSLKALSGLGVAL